MPTKEQLEQQAAAKKKEAERLRNQKAKTGNAGPLGGVSQMAKEIFNPAGRGKTPVEPTPPAAAEPAPQTDQQKFLARGGVNEAAQGQDPTQFNQNAALRGQVIRGEKENLSYRTNPALRGAQQALPDTELGRAGREFLANSQDVNLGNFGTQGGPNIYGRASTPGGRLDTFTGVGTPDPKSPTTVVNQGAAEAGVRGPSAQAGFNPTGYDNANPYGGAHANAAFGASARLRPQAGQGARAAEKQFQGQAGGLRMQEIRNINRQANSAFNQALESGMNTKSALRVADNIRAGAGALTDQDKVAAQRYGSDQGLRGTQYASDTQLVAESMRQEGYNNRAAEQNAQQAAQAVAASRDGTFKRNMDMVRNTFRDPEGNIDDAAFARGYFAAGGEETFKGLTGTQTQKAMKGAVVMANRLDAVNQYLAENGVNQRFDNLGDFFAGTNLIRDPDTGTMKLGKREFTTEDAMSGKIGWGQIWSEGIQLADGTLVPTDVWEKGGPMTNEERQSLEIMIPEDR